MNRSVTAEPARRPTAPGWVVLQDAALEHEAIFDVQDQTASAKLTAWWGTDYLLLAKNDGRWQIAHVLWQSTS